MSTTKPRYVQTRYPTLYELVATHTETGERVLIAYARRRTRQGLWHAITGERLESVVRLCGTKTIDFAKRAADGAVMGVWHLKFSGRTARDCQGAELPFVCDRS